MIRIKNLFMGGCLPFMAFGPLMAESSTLSLLDFTFEGKPLGPECFLPLVSSSSAYEPVVLKGNACQEKQQEYDKEKLKKGIIGYTVENESHMMKAPYSFYRLLGKVHFQNMTTPSYDLIELQWSNGTTESSSGLLVVEKTDKWLRLVQMLDQGDRCFGSVHDAKLAEGILTYNKQITAQGLFNLLYQKKETKESPPLFDDCAVCCIGEVSLKNNQVEGIHFTVSLKDIKNKLAQENVNSPQGCFDKIFEGLLETEQTSLSLDELKAFGQKVTDHCLAEKDISSS